MELDGKILVNLTQGSVVCEKVEIADRAKSRMRGLLGRDSLGAGDGMLLQPAPSIHTAFMHFTIDAVFFDGTLRVKKIVPALRPWRVASARGCWGVLELAEGEVAHRGVHVGDQLGVVQITDELGAVEDKASWQRWNWTSIAGPSVEADQMMNGRQANGRGPTEDGEEPERANTPDAARVLVVGSDRRFRSVAAALLTRRGCAVTLSDRSANVVELVRTERAEVVVLDAGLSLTDAARGAAQIETIEMPVGLVIVGEDLEQGLATMPVLPKWGSFDRLYEAIVRARPGRSRRWLHGGIS